MSTGFLFLCEVIALAFGLYFGVQWQLAAREADAYYAASACQSGQMSGCTTQKIVSVVNIRSSRYNKSDHDFVTVRGPDTAASTEVEVGDGYDTWVSLTPGAPLTAIYWNHALVALRGPNPPVIHTTDHPAWRADDHKRHTEIAWFIAAVVALLILLKLTGIDTAGRLPAQPAPTSAESFQFSHVDDPPRT